MLDCHRVRNEKVQQIIGIHLPSTMLNIDIESEYDVIQEDLVYRRKRLTLNNEQRSILDI